MPINNKNHFVRSKSTWPGKCTPPELGQDDLHIFRQKQWLLLRKPLHISARHRLLQLAQISLHFAELLLQQ